VARRFRALLVDPRVLRCPTGANVKRRNSSPLWALRDPWVATANLIVLLSSTYVSPVALETGW